MNTETKVSRRQVLKGLAVLSALPVVAACAVPAARQAAAPLRPPGK